MSDTKARARRRAFCPGSFDKKGLADGRGALTRGAVGIAILTGREENGGRTCGAPEGCVGALGAAAGRTGAGGGTTNGGEATPRSEAGDDAIGGRGGGTTAAGGGDGARTATGGGASPTSATTRKTARQTEHRARTPPVGTLAGSTRNTVEQLGQVTFIAASSTLVPALAGGG